MCGTWLVEKKTEALMKSSWGVDPQLTWDFTAMGGELTRLLLGYLLLFQWQLSLAD